MRRRLLAVIAIACAPSVGSSAPTATVLEIARATFHKCALLSNGTVRCAGKNDEGQLGDGTVLPRTSSVTVVALSDAIQISKGGWGSTCVVHADLHVSCWGRYNGGALGVDPSKCIPHPSWTTKAPYACAISPVLGLPAKVVQVAQSINGACARMDDGTLRCWGSSLRGELGFPAGAPVSPPRTVAGIDHVRFVALGQSHACALRDDGTVWCWGGNEYGALGDGTQTDRTIPKPVLGLADVVEIDLGMNHSCARKKDGHVWCWGSNVFGEIGDKYAVLDKCPIWVSSGAAGKWNPLLCRKTPTEVFGVDHAAQLSVGDLESCARHDDGSLTCWPSDADSGPAKATPMKRAKGRVLKNVSLGHDGACLWNVSGKIECWSATDHVLSPFFP